MIGEFFKRKLNKAKLLSLGLETISQDGVTEMSDLKKGSLILGYEDGAEVLNKVENIEPITGRGTYFCINGKVTLFENQSIVANGRVTHAKLLKRGDELVGIGGKKILIHTLEKVTGNYHFYRMTVSGKHTYFLNGILMHNASRFWVGGTGTWDTTTLTHWAATSGGAGGQSVPTSSDDVTFNSASNATAYTVNFSASTGENCNDLNMAGPASGAVTWASNFSLNIFGSMTLTGGSAKITRTFSGQIIFKATSTGKTVTTSGVQFNTSGNQISFNGVGGGWTLQDALDMGIAASNQLVLTNGSLDTNGKTVTASSMNCNGAGNTCSLTLGASTVNVTSWGSNGGGLTVSAASSTIVVTPSAVAAFNGGGNTFNNVTVTLPSTNATFTIGQSNTFANLTVTINTAAPFSTLILGGNQTITTAFSAKGTSTSGLTRLAIRSDAAGTQRTITSASNTFEYADFQDIVGAGAGSWNLAAITGLSGDCGGNSGITFTTPTSVSANGTSSFNWSTIARWNTRNPLPQDTVTVGLAFAGASVVTMDTTYPGKDITFAGSTWGTSLTITPTANIMQIMGSLTFISGMLTTSTTSAIGFGGRSGGTITTSGVTINSPLTILSGSGVYLLGSDLTLLSSRALGVTSGTFSAVNGASNYIINAGQIFATLASTLTLGSATHVLTGTSGVFSIAATATMTASTGTIKITDTSNSTTSFGGGGKTFNNVWFSRGASTASNTISGSNTFNDFKDDGTAAHSILFTAATTQTVTTFTVSGSAGNLISINSNSTATHALVKSGGGTISSDYLNIQHSVATPSSTWYAGDHSTNNQAVSTAGSGWIFTTVPVLRTETGVASISLISTQTETGLARISGITPRTEAGLARLQKSVSQTETGLSRITSIVSKTETGLARITAAALKTETGVARIQKSASQTETGLGRIEKSVTQAETGLSRITAATPRTETGTARITATTPRTITGKGDILKATLQTESGLSRIGLITAKTETGLSRVTAITPKTESGLARLTASTSRTETGIADIAKTTTRTEAGLARIQKAVLQTITGLARIGLITSKTASGVSRITATALRTVSGLSRITAAVLKTESGIARITASTSRTVTGKGRIQVTVLKTETGLARIQKVVLQTESGLARITAATLRTETGLTRIQKAVAQTETGKGRITATTTKIESGVGRVQKSASQTELGIARIRVSVSRTIAGTGSVGVQVNRTVTGKSRITKVVAQVAQGRARIQKTILEIITGQSRIERSRAETITGVASIAAPVKEGHEAYILTTTVPAIIDLTTAPVSALTSAENKTVL